MTEELIEYINQVPDKEETCFTIDGDSYKINLGYKLFVFNHNSNYTIEEIVGSYLGHNPYLPSFEDWKAQNSVCDDFYSYDESSLGGDRICWQCSRPLSYHD